MAEVIRSNSGCWTCRVRRKKCDEKQPECARCDALNLPCHGYGPKPSWMDRGMKEREVAASLRKIVRQTLTLQKLGLSQQDQNNSRAPTAESTNSFLSEELRVPYMIPNENDLDSDLNALGLEGLNLTNPLPVEPTPILDSNLDNTVSRGNVASQKSPTGAAAAITNTLRNERVERLLTSESWSTPPDRFEEDQASLLMHFFDHVLPLQFRFYNPSIVEGGRGWLLSVPIRTKPLYHVVLSLAAYHQQSVLVRGSGVPCKASLAKLQERHVECIKVLRLHLEKLSGKVRARSSEEQVDTLACISFLIALELFRGDTNDWQMHLKGASALCPNLERDPNIVEPATHTQKLAVEFFSGVIAWYEILSCASTGRRPFSSSDIHDETIFLRIRFDKLMGCESWLMSLITEIAILSGSKTSLEANGELSMREFDRRAAGIRMRLERGLALSSRDPTESMPLEERASQASSTVLSASTVKVVTQIFGCAALVYLEVLVLGPCPSAPGVQHGVLRTMSALKGLEDKSLVRNLLWPVCIAGSMAIAEHQPYWRDLVADVSRPQWSFGYPSKVLRVMEECWSLSSESSEGIVTVDWRTAMRNLEMTILLV